MQTRAAILYEPHTDWKIETIELDPPKAGEVLVKLAATGLCHSDEHAVTGDMPTTLPLIGGHEGAGRIEAVGPGVTELAVGDHVVFSFLPSCGRCPSCAAGQQNLCDLGAYLGGYQISDGTARHHANGQDLHTMCLLGTFAEHTVVNVASAVKIDPDISLERACLLGCGVTTGWGSAVYAGRVGPGDAVAVVGVGGLGSSAVQGARLAGAEKIFAIDPVAFKRDSAKAFGATHTAASVADAVELIREATLGRMCNAVISTMGVGRGAEVAGLLSLAAKRGKVVITNIHPWNEMEISANFLELTLWEKQLIGSIFGSANPRYDIPQLARLYRGGQLDLDGMVTRTYSLDELNQGYQDMRDGKNIRGVVVFD
jgi:S-(hydroxymethyl)glutathione dehydrogenase/alcohol dehydrogenase